MLSTKAPHVALSALDRGSGGSQWLSMNSRVVCRPSGEVPFSRVGRAGNDRFSGFRLAVRR